MGFGKHRVLPRTIHVLAGIGRGAGLVSEEARMHCADQAHHDPPGYLVFQNFNNNLKFEAAWGIEYLHERPIIHRDLASRNCLYGDGKVR